MDTFISHCTDKTYQYSEIIIYNQTSDPLLKCNFSNSNIIMVSIIVKFTFWYAED